MHHFPPRNTTYLKPDRLRERWSIVRQKRLFQKVKKSKGMYNPPTFCCLCGCVKRQTAERVSKVSSAHKRMSDTSKCLKRLKQTISRTPRIAKSRSSSRITRRGRCCAPIRCAICALASRRARRASASARTEAEEESGREVGRVGPPRSAV